MGRLDGYKTYIAGGLAVLSAVGAWLTGDAELRETLQRVWTVVEPLALVFLAAKGNRIVNAISAQPSNVAR